MADFTLNAAQMEAMQSTAKETWLLCGVGSGKTTFNGCALYRALSRPRTVHGLFAPTRKVLQKATWPQIQSAWHKMGLVSGVHYMIGRQPPKSWGIPKFSDVGAHSILTTRWGSYCAMDGLDNYDAQRGMEFDEIFTDETRDISAEARLVLLSRLRGPRYAELGLETRLTHATTPPDNPTHLLDLLESSRNGNHNIKFIQASSHVNKANLPGGYIEMLQSMYDPITFRREVMAELVASGKSPFCYAFDRKKHISADVGRNLIRQREPVWLSFDFNVDPATCIAAQHLGKSLTVVKEFYLANASIFNVCDAINAAFPNSIFYVTGDATGKGRNAIGKGLQNFYDIISAELGINYNRFEVPSVNPAIRDTRVLVNSLFEHYPSIQIASDCPRLIRDLETVQMTEKGDIDKKDSELTHLLDCYRYLCNTLFPDYFAKTVRKPL